MGKKKKKDAAQAVLRKPSRAAIAAQIILIYLGIVATTIFLTINCDIVLYLQAQPSLWLHVIWFVYYFLPVILAIIFGTTFRPFWINARNVLVSILAIHVFVSFGVTVVRHEYVRRQDLSIQQSRWAQFKVVELDKEIFDDNDDSVIDRMLFHGTFDMGEFPGGQYRLAATLIKTGEEGRKFTVGSFIIPWETREGNIFKGHFEMDFSNSPRAFKDGVFRLDLDLERMMTVDSLGKGIISVSRWVPFFRTTRWDGTDPDIKDQTLPLAHVHGVESFTILPLEI